MVPSFDMALNVVPYGKVFLCVRCRSGVSLLSKQVKSAKKKDTAESSKQSKSNAGSSKGRQKTGTSDKTSGKPLDVQKFELYFDFKAYVHVIKPHQVGVLSAYLFS